MSNHPSPFMFSWTPTKVQHHETTVLLRWHPFIMEHSAHPDTANNFYFQIETTKTEYLLGF